MRNESAGLPGSVQVVTRAGLRGLPQWPRSFAKERKDHRYYEIVEDTVRQGFEYHYAVLRDSAGRVTAVQPFFVLDQDLMQGTGDGMQRIMGQLRKAVPGLLKLRTLMIGCAAGEGHLDAGDDVSGARIAAQLADALPGIARSFGAKLIVFKEFPARERTALAPLLSRGFTRVPSLPMTRRRLDFRCFEEYMATKLSANTRQQLRRKFKAAEKTAKIDMDVVTDVSDIIGDIFPLYRATMERSKLKFEILTEEYFVRLGREMPDKVRYFLWRREGRIIAFNLCMIDENTITSEYIGLDYSLAFDLSLYHIVTRDIMMWAIGKNYPWYQSTALNYEPKFRLRQELAPLDLYVRHTSPIVNPAMRRILPLVEPTRSDPVLKRFANYADLKG